MVGALDLDLANRLRDDLPMLATDVSRQVARDMAQVLLSLKLPFDVSPMVRVGKAAPPSNTTGIVLATLGLVAVVTILGGLVLWKVLTADASVDRKEPEHARHSPPPDPSHDVKLSDAVKSVVSVRCSHSVGSGFYVGAYTVVTNKHVICEGAEKPTIVRSSGTHGQVSEVKTDATHDLAVMQVDLVGPPLEVADAAATELGSEVAIIGSPRGLDFSVHRGNLSFIGRAKGGVGYLQIDSAVNPGNSGGPLLDAHGRVIGVVTARLLDTEGIGFAVPVNYLVSGAHAVWSDGPTDQLLTDDWTAFEARTRRSETEEAQAPKKVEPPAPEPEDGEFKVRLTAARWVNPRKGELEVVVVSNDASGGDQRWLMELKAEDERLCDVLRTKTVAWVRLESTDPNLAPHLREQLLAANLDRKLYVGVLRVAWSSCPLASSHNTAELALELPGAVAPYHRVGIKR